MSLVNWACPINRGLTGWWLHLPGERRPHSSRHLFDPRLEAHGYATASPSNFMAPGPPGLWGAWDFGNTALNDRVSVPNGFTNLLSGQAVNTVALWVWARSFTVAPVFLSHGDSSTEWFHEFTTGGAIYWGNGASFRTYSAPVCSTRTWCHLIFSKTGAGDSGNLYVDGVLTTSYTGTIGTTPSTTKDLWIGNYNSAGLGLDGRIDDLRIYSTRALTAEEAWNLYTESRLGYPTALNRPRRDVAQTIAAAPSARIFPPSAIRSAWHPAYVE